MRLTSFFILLFTLVRTCAFGQINKSVTYIGNVGSATGTSVLVQTDVTGGTMVFLVLANPTADETSVTLNAQRSGQFSSTKGLAVTYALTENTVTGTIAGLAYTASREPLLGAQMPVSGIYSGVIEQGPGQRSYGLRIDLFPSGTMFLQGLTADGKHVYATGTRQVDGAASLRFMNGAVASFNFPAGNGSFQITTNVPGMPNGSSNLLIGYSRSKGSTLVNVATRGQVTKGKPMIAGFVINDAPKLVLIRVVGPTLSVFGVPDTNTDPKLTLFMGSAVLHENDNWETNANVDEIKVASSGSGAFSLNAGSKDAALLVNLLPGAYTAQASTDGVGGDTLVEVYEVSKY